MDIPATGMDPIAASRPVDAQPPASGAPERITTFYRNADDEREGVSTTDDKSSSEGVARFAPDDPPDAPLGEKLSSVVNATDNVARPSSEACDAEVAGPAGRLRSIFASTCDDVWHDYGNYYSRSTALEFTAILAPAAVSANTDMDANFATWYQTHIRSADTNRAADFFRPLGNGYYTIPVYVSAKFIGEYFDDVPGMNLLGQFGDRASRALLVGAPPLLAVQYATGGGRPSDYADQSYWRPFHGSHGASGHAFMGAVPFLTLAGMTDDPFAKCFFYACSPWTGMSRINDNVHYLSQVWLGWWMAYLACESVNKTESQKGPLVVTPLITSEMSGVGVVYEH
jgi:hypothetical protein